MKTMNDLISKSVNVEDFEHIINELYSRQDNKIDSNFIKQTQILQNLELKLDSTIESLTRRC